VASAEIEMRGESVLHGSDNWFGIFVDDEEEEAIQPRLNLHWDFPNTFYFFLCLGFVAADRCLASVVNSPRNIPIW
jgi:hypothetical protein